MSEKARHDEKRRHSKEMNDRNNVVINDGRLLCC
jgi:hypothetical protein